jgi:hypothetical protein
MSKIKIKKTTRKQLDEWRTRVTNALTQLVEGQAGRRQRWSANRHTGRTSFGWSDYNNVWLVRCEKDNGAVSWYIGTGYPHEGTTHRGIKEFGFLLPFGGKDDVPAAASVVRFLRSVKDEIVATYESGETPRLVKYVKNMQESWEADTPQHHRLNQLNITPYRVLV